MIQDILLICWILLVILIFIISYNKKIQRYIIDCYIDLYLDSQDWFKLFEGCL